MMLRLSLTPQSGHLNSIAWNRTQTNQKCNESEVLGKAWEDFTRAIRHLTST